MHDILKSGAADAAPAARLGEKPASTTTDGNGEHAHGRAKPDLSLVDGRRVMPSEVRFAIVRKMLEKAGWTLVRISGSHHYFQKPGSLPLSIPVHGNKVKPVYVKQIKKQIEEDETKA